MLKGLTIICATAFALATATAYAATPAPLFTPTQRVETSAPPQFALSFFNAIAADQGTAVISTYAGRPTSGEPFAQWRTAAVYIRENGQWTLQAQLNAATPEIDAQTDFGRVVAIKGDLIVVGDPQIGSLYEGRAYIYRRTNNVWALEATLTLPEESYFFRQLGSAVAIDSLNSNRVLIGAEGLGAGGEIFGARPTAVYVFERSSTGWALEAALRPEELEMSTLTDARLALQGNLAVISAPARAEAYTFSRQADGSWLQGQTLWTPYRSEATGISMSLDGDRLILGDTITHLTFEYPDEEEVRVANAEGDAYLYERGRDGKWRIKERFRDVLLDAGLTEFHGIGATAFLGGRLAIVGEGTGYVLGYPEKAYVLKQEAGRWKLAQTFTSANDPETGLDFVSFDGTDLCLARNPLRGGRGYLEIFRRSGTN